MVTAFVGDDRDVQHMLNLTRLHNVNSCCDLTDCSSLAVTETNAACYGHSFVTCGPLDPFKVYIDTLSASD